MRLCNICYLTQTSLQAGSLFGGNVRFGDNCASAEGAPEERACSQARPKLSCTQQYLFPLVTQFFLNSFFLFGSCLLKVEENSHSVIRLSLILYLQHKELHKAVKESLKSPVKTSLYCTKCYKIYLNTPQHKLFFE